MVEQSFSLMHSFYKPTVIPSIAQIVVKSIAMAMAHFENVLGF